MLRTTAACLVLAATSAFGFLGARALSETAAAEPGLATTIVTATVDPITSEPDEEPEPSPEPEPEEPVDQEGEEKQSDADAVRSTPEPTAPSPTVPPATVAQPNAVQTAPAPKMRVTPARLPSQPPRSAKARHAPSRAKALSATPTTSQASTASAPPPRAVQKTAGKSAPKAGSPPQPVRRKLFDLPLVSSLMPEDPPVPPRALAAAALAATGAGMIGIFAMVLRFVRRTWNP